MRAWVVVWIGLCASVASAEEAASDSGVPPLADDETAPAEPPNYFDTRELGARTVAAALACEEAMGTAVPDLDQQAAASYCACFADTARANVRAGVAWTLTESQYASCGAIARGERRPAQPRPSIPTASILPRYQACVDAMPEGTPALYSAFACGCATDAWLADRASARKLADDLIRCNAAATYREQTGQPPTRRQFAAISTKRAPYQERQPSSGEFIPYEGNGRGPTLCRDGMMSHSSGRGTCSHHGGVAGGRRRRH